MSKWTNGHDLNVTLDDDSRSIWLKLVLLKNNITVTELAKRLEVRTGTVARWLRRDWKESQKTEGLKKVHFLAICQALDLKDEDWDSIK